MVLYYKNNDDDENKNFLIVCDYVDSDAPTIDLNTILNDQNNLIIYDYNI